MNIDELKYDEKLKLLKEIVQSINETDTCETIELNDESLIVNKHIIAYKTIDQMNIGNIVDEDSLDESIWNFVDLIGDEIRGLAYDYAYDNNIEIRRV